MGYKPGDIAPHDGEVHCKGHPAITVYVQAGKRFAAAHDGAGPACEWEYRHKAAPSAHRGGLTLGEVQDQIFQREGFRVSFVPLGSSDHPLAPYDYPVMAPNGWRVSDWRRIRLAPYIVSFRDVFIYRGDGDRIGADVKLGHLRDTYYAAQYGTLAAEAAMLVPTAHAAPLPATKTARRHAARPRRVG
jgi:hypothetical protein